MSKNLTLANLINTHVSETGADVMGIVSRLLPVDYTSIVLVDTNTNPADDRVRLRAVMADDESVGHYDTRWTWDGQRWNVWHRPYDNRPYRVRYREAYPTKQAQPVRESEPPTFRGLGRREGKCERRQVRLACAA